MKIIRQIGSIMFVMGLFICIFLGIPWYTVAAEDPVTPWWLRLSIFCLLAGILVVLTTLSLEQKGVKEIPREPADSGATQGILLMTSDTIPGREITEVVGMVQGHTVYAIWLGRDLSAIVRLILGGELTEYTDMMGRARATANKRMAAKASEMGADAVINIRYTTTSVIGSAAELLVYGTAVKLS